MLATVTGTYKNGQIILDEDLPVKSETAKVIVTLVGEGVRKTTPQFGRLKGTFTDPYWSSEEFNAPLDDLKDCM